jgi:hypothetical protein
MLTDVAVAWVGWYRADRSAPWERLSEGPTYADAWGSLLEKLPGKGPGGESVILPATKHPSETAASGRPFKRRRF